MNLLEFSVATFRATSPYLILVSSGAGEGIRTPDPLITNQMLYQLSYAGTWCVVNELDHRLWLAVQFDSQK